MRRVVSGIVGVTLWGSVLAVVVCGIVRVFLPEASEELRWGRIVILAGAIPLLFLAVPFVLCCLPTQVHLTDKGVMFQFDSSGSFFKYEQIESLSFVEEEGRRLFEVRAKSKKGDLIVRTAIASPNVRDEDVSKFLADIGQLHLWRERDLH